MATKDGRERGCQIAWDLRTWFASLNQCRGRGAVLCSRVAPVGEGNLLVEGNWLDGPLTHLRYAPFTLLRDFAVSVHVMF